MSEQTEAARGRAAAATPGPWEHREVAEDGEFRFQTVMAGQAMVCDDEGCFNLDQERANLVFIAAARMDVPWLCDRVDELEAALREYGHHKPRCAANYSSKPTLDKCDCGLARAVLSGEPEAKETT